MNTLILPHLVSILLAVGIDAGYGAEPAIPEWARKALREAQSNEVPVEFYGRVVDQFGGPVVGAEVKVHVQQVGVLYVWEPPPVNYAVKTDSQGKFAIPPQGERTANGLSLMFDAMRKEGYEPVRDDAFLRGYRYAKGDIGRFAADKLNPVILHMRKKGDVAFLLQEQYLDLSIQSTESGKPSGRDLVRRHRIKDMANLVYDGEPLICDLQVKATFNTNDATWAVVLSPGNTNGGIIVSEQLLYEAPQDGYQPQYTFTPEDYKTPKAKYLYVRSRHPAIYTRLEIEYINANNEFFRLSGKSVTNPYGDRNLEQATDLPYEVTKQLTDDAKAAFRENKRPTKPDLPKLIKEAKEKAEKDKSKP